MASEATKTDDGGPATPKRMYGARRPEQVKFDPIPASELVKMPRDPNRTETPWTEGPWTVEKQRPGQEFTAIGGPVAVIGGDELCEEVEFVVGTLRDEGPHGNEQTKANAYLIGAAPCLYAALLRLVNEPGINQDDLPSVGEAIAAARAALTLATQGAKA